MSEIRTCLKSKFLWIQILDISLKCLKSEPQGSDFRHILKKSLKTELWSRISDTQYVIVLNTHFSIFSIFYIISYLNHIFELFMIFK